MAIVLYNTLTKSKEPLEPISQGKVGMYVCGITVYDLCHLGHAKSVVNFDVVVRHLRRKGFEVKHVTNFTDVDDKIIQRARERGMEPLALSQSMIDEYFNDMAALKVRKADVYPKASETMPDIIDMVKGLVDKGHAYESNGSVYFSVRKAKEYGKLSGQSLDQMVAGARIEPGEDKRDPMDFALWKAAKPDEISWDSPWGKGRPGWHIECSAMCLKHIGKTVDIHGGGTELVFPHHENEILQSEAFNDAPFVKYWMHNGLLTLDEEKMSKSLKNFFLIRDILKKCPPEVVRFYLLNASYRQPLDYSEKSLEEAGKALERLQNTYDSLGSAAKSASGTEDAEELCGKASRQIEEKMDDDFSTREAIAAMFDLAREANRLISERRLSAEGVRNLRKAFDEFNDLFDVLRASPGAASADDADVDRLVRAREEARRKKDFAEADRLRKELADMGVVVQDTKDGAVWKRK
ncbi:MAG: cysteine--tRNA ligase [Euryarchaeota archaeon RBG_16_62_10]|nr:MAG: cysteine--tRNA ligase [Euryarchaeota archaeon RBG_16_62_10]